MPDPSSVVAVLRPADAGRAGLLVDAVAGGVEAAEAGGGLEGVVRAAGRVVALLV